MIKSIKWILILISGLFLLVCTALLGLYLAVLLGLFGRLPSSEELASLKNEQASLVYASDGTLIGKIFTSNRTNIKWEEIPDQLVNALVCTEDKRFYSHEGIDKQSYIRVLFKSILAGDNNTGGGSTLSQQLVKNFYGRKNLGFLTFPVAKIREAILAHKIEKIYSKSEILLLYLNSVPFGENVFGIEAAAQRFFTCGAKNLKVEQMALLVGMLKANTIYNPRLNPENSMKRRNQVLQLMCEQNYLQKLVADSLKELPLGIHYSNYELDAPAGYFVYQVTLKSLEILKEIETNTGIHYELKKDGLRIKTTLDIELQKIASQSSRVHLINMQKLLDKELKIRNARSAWENKMSKRKDPNWKKNPEISGDIFEWTENHKEVIMYRDSLWHYYRMLNAAVLMIEPGTGKILTWIGGNNYRFLPYDLVLSKRQIASAFKPVLYASALENGISPCDYLDNEEKVYQNYNYWHPQNFDNTSGGRIAVWYALAHSMNLPTIDLYFRTGHVALKETCKNLGLSDLEEDYPSVSLGSLEVTLLEIVRAYSAFANKGLLTEPIMIESISDANGKVIYTNPVYSQKQVISNEVSSQITAMLETAINEGTGNNLRKIYNVKTEIAGKTGTAQDYSDAWFLSYSPNLIIGTWVGAMDPAVHFQSSNGSGSLLALPIDGMIWSEIEKALLLKAKYTGSFGIADSFFDQMDCDPIKEPNVIKEYFNRITNKDKRFTTQTSQENIKDKKKDKSRNFFQKIFKKKEK